MLVLFDVDETLIQKSGAHRLAFKAAFKKVWGLDASIDEIEPQGMTDPAILAAVCRKHKVPDDEVRAGMDDATATMVLEYGRLVRDAHIGLMPGVRDLLEILRGSGHKLGLVTGNLEAIAWEKLQRAGIRHFFDAGGFGSDDSERARLIPVAAARFGMPLSEAVVVGDTPRDIEAAHANGVPCVGVASGRYSLDDLSDADLALASLEEKEKFLGLLGEEEV